ncbi:Ku70/Ku80 beta-barrel domain protein [Acididesulfobacillus acetoxydans]|uniref:Non-homologous end joining protein Ku n=1 Tax=Acididesulfobacillus acetoxydans TaxID=1561005 RepID=A0A8S0Y3Y8_9FIRM|nr:Ku protein [Acididesulfobacillus acetoxydans]CAA7602565.1 Ku70/Ku80 beta-barrel domain protein [Acididesulfobacillus acetoxydans]CEJ07289.1 YkoV protein [Acididesulfobacillus acetoxydans]
MHTLWKGSISFGLVNVPVKMQAATESKEFQFHYLHNACQGRIRYVKQCPRCKTEVENRDLVKGYEYEKDRYVILTDEELASVQEPSARSIDILDFVDLKEIDPVYYQKSYYLSPEDTAAKAYRLLCLAMLESGKVALAHLTLRSKQYLACLRVFEEGLVLETMFYADEIRRMERPWQEIQPTETELMLARQLVEQLAKPFEPGKYRDGMRDKLAEMIEQKVKGESLRVPTAPRGGQVLDLMEALRASIARAEEKKDGARESDAEGAEENEEPPEDRSLSNREEASVNRQVNTDVSGRADESAKARADASENANTEAPATTGAAARGARTKAPATTGTAAGGARTKEPPGPEEPVPSGLKPRKRAVKAKGA